MIIVVTITRTSVIVEITPAMGASRLAHLGANSVTSNPNTSGSNIVIRSGAAIDVALTAASGASNGTINGIRTTVIGMRSTSSDVPIGRWPSAIAISLIRNGA